jgi:hypothetical protein
MFILVYVFIEWDVEGKIATVHVTAENGTTIAVSMPKDILEKLRADIVAAFRDTAAPNPDR